MGCDTLQYSRNLQTFLVPLQTFVTFYKTIQMCGKTAEQIRPDQTRHKSKRDIAVSFIWRGPVTTDSSEQCFCHLRRALDCPTCNSHVVMPSKGNRHLWKHPTDKTRQDMCAFSHWYPAFFPNNYKYTHLFIINCISYHDLSLPGIFLLLGCYAA